jgi:predicted nucleic acid-binding protein
MAILSVGWAEVASILVRRRNSGRMTPAQYHFAVRQFRAEVGPAAAVEIVDVTRLLADRAVAFIERYSINSTDAILLRSALDLVTILRGRTNDLFLAAGDRRLLRAAQAEGLATFNPETQSAADLDALLGP